MLAGIVSQEKVPRPRASRRQAFCWIAAGAARRNPTGEDDKDSRTHVPVLASPFAH